MPLHQMQGAQNVRSEAYLQVRRNDEGEAQSRSEERDRWIFYEAIIVKNRMGLRGASFDKEGLTFLIISVLFRPQNRFFCVHLTISLILPIWLRIFSARGPVGSTLR